MKIVKFTSGDTYTPFAPWWEYYFCEDNLKISLTDLKEEILSKEKDIIDQYEFEDDWGTKLGPNSLTSRSNRYNLLEFDTAVQSNSFDYGEPTATGFTITTGQSATNNNGDTYIYYAHA